MMDGAEEDYDLATGPAGKRQRKGRFKKMTPKLQDRVQDEQEARKNVEDIRTAQARTRAEKEKIAKMANSLLAATGDDIDRDNDDDDDDDNNYNNNNHNNDASVILKAGNNKNNASSNDSNNSNNNANNAGDIMGINGSTPAHVISLLVKEANFMKEEEFKIWNDQKMSGLALRHITSMHQLMQPPFSFCFGTAATLFEKFVRAQLPQQQQLSPLARTTGIGVSHTSVFLSTQHENTWSTYARTLLRTYVNTRLQDMRMMLETVQTQNNLTDREVALIVLGVIPPSLQDDLEEFSDGIAEIQSQVTTSKLVTFSKRILVRSWSQSCPRDAYQDSVSASKVAFENWIGTFVSNWRANFLGHLKSATAKYKPSSPFNDIPKQNAGGRKPMWNNSLNNR